ncbi:trk-type K+ transport system, membrane component [Actinobacillus pleuropneumoniae]|uniref:TrkH family potassium uptake protein n=1 Tax=Actinobacillus pleuropneumoniae TaxID=715 RepID=UPI0001E4A445|nr:TrkH family potassium uptake protein [Actinobacillus pleuropneumoniae]EFM89247.1 Trk system potassium uptake protein trkH [Actinobacillus pleuropneumoniae serovar 4 str. M62]MBT9319584.1 TrkH family potassium uptake protein [Actinobacillus pleuropneumoniae]MBT9344418.1 TrkH family potassium uptake protein [Actinobacillus pleuropneumoniae]UKH23269.1 potassium transporter [Actinobacillus pleuropneumoniae]UKH25222.1 potassium transporter [Actinobacillus pleuropneumoniae]
MQFLSILRIVGILVMSFSFTMLLPAFVALIYGDGGGREFLQSFLLTFSVGTLLWWFSRNQKNELRSREGFLIVVLFWVVLGSLGAVPFIILEHPDLNFSESIFESFSGLTTTGATVITGLDDLPKAILFYRQFLQWLGGMGIIVLAIAIIPLIGLGKLYRAEMPGPLKDQKMRPRIAEISKLLWQIYLSLTVLCALAFKIAGMSWFDAICHSFATISIGGFSTHDASIGYFDSIVINSITAVFLLISSINFGLHFALIDQLKDKNNKQTGNIFKRLYWKDYEFRSFAVIQLSLFLICFAILSIYNYFGNAEITFQHALFQSVSISTTAGFTTNDFSQWPSFLPILLVMASFIGGCAGSTGGGLKVIRVMLLYLQANREIHRFVHPNSVKPIKLGAHIFSERIEEGIWAFFSAYIFVFVMCWFGTIAFGMETFDAFNAVVASLNNLGPALGNVSSNFTQVPDGAKWILTIAMVCGRLEVFTLLVILSPVFWKD